VTWHYERAQIWCRRLCGWHRCLNVLRACTHASLPRDIVTCDLPFGKMHLGARDVSRLYPAALRQVSRVLRVGGRAVLLGMRTPFNNMLLNGVLPLEIRYQRLVDKGGLMVALYVLERVEEEEWARHKSEGRSEDAAVKSGLKKNRHGKEHAERSRERAAARVARGETVGAPTRDNTLKAKASRSTVESAVRGESANQ